MEEQNKKIELKGKAKMYYEKDANLDLLKDKTIAIIGCGSQGHAHALNLQDSGLNIVVGLYEGSKTWQKAEKVGLKVMKTSDAAKKADIIMMLIPDTKQPKVYKEEIEPNLSQGKALAFAHGFNLHFKTIIPPKNIDVFMVAPKGPGHLLRAVYQQGFGVPCLIAIQQDYTGKAKDIALAYAKGLGGTRAGVIETTFEEETETDLFGEQVVLCGGVSSLIKAAFETLVEAGYQPEVAYFECLHELKLITDLIYKGGLSAMRYSVSDTAEFGDYVSGKKVINEETKQRMKEILKEIQDGTFAKKWIKENEEGLPNFMKMRQQDIEHPIEKIGKELRAMMKTAQIEEKGPKGFLEVDKFKGKNEK